LARWKIRITELNTGVILKTGSGEYRFPRQYAAAVRGIADDHNYEIAESASSRHKKKYFRLLDKIRKS